MQNQGRLSLVGVTSIKVVRGVKAPFTWKFKNAAKWAFIKGWLARWLIMPIARSFGLMVGIGELQAILIKEDGTKINYGLLGYRVVTTAFVTALATYMYDASGPAPTAYDYHDSGVGVTAENVTDTDIETTDGESRVAGTPTNPSAGLYRSTGTIAYTTTKAITEHGLFSASTAGTLLDRTVFTAINVSNGDSIQFTYTLTLTAGS